MKRLELVLTEAWAGFNRSFGALKTVSSPGVLIRIKIY